MRHLPALTIATGLLFAANAAHAYIGPGAGLSAIGAVIAVLAAMILAVVGFVWYPVKRLMRRRSAARKKPQQANAER